MKVEILTVGNTSIQVVDRMRQCDGLMPLIIKMDTDMRRMLARLN